MLSNWVVKGTDTEKDEMLQKNEVTLQNRGLSENSCRVCLLLVNIYYIFSECKELTLTPI